MFIVYEQRNFRSLNFKIESKNIQFTETIKLTVNYQRLFFPILTVDHERKMYLHRPIHNSFMFVTLMIEICHNHAFLAYIHFILKTS